MKEFINVAIPPLTQALSYRLSNSSDNIDVGDRVLVPLGKRKIFGYVISKESEPNIDLKPKVSSQLSLESFDNNDITSKIKSIEPHQATGRCFLPEQLEFFKKVSEYYGSPLSNVIDVAIPSVITEKKKQIIKLLDKDPQLPKRSKKAQAIVSELQKNGPSIDYEDLKRLEKGILPVLKKLAEQGVVSISEQSVDPQFLNNETVSNWAIKEATLNDQQNRALQYILKYTESEKFRQILLHGITGSGKTEIYIEAAAKVLEKGKTVIIIVPEIALTPQLIDRFKARLGNNIASLHSGLSKRTRWESWQALLTGRCNIAIGARSAIFAPLKNVGLVIVDEEHDSSYKQSDGLRYNARDMAILKAQMSSCPVVLGSATPSLESYLQARSGRFSLVEISNKFAAHQKLDIEVIDLKSVKPWEMVSPNISPRLLSAIENAIANREQVFLLYNRRGFASFLQCDTCGTPVQCPNCSVTLTYHHFRNSLVCHYCGLNRTPSQFCTICPSVGNKEPGTLSKHGSGTERIFEEISDLFPDAQVDRLDRDTVNSVDSYKEILNKVRSGQTSILVGTQMIAKGHDLPNVTLVGVIDCDVGLHMPDFRAAERSFQLLTQVAGRAGRGEKPGTVILQTRIPNHPSIKKTLEHDYIGFAKGELGQRQKLEYPPFVRLMRIVASSTIENTILPALESLKQRALEIIQSQNLSVKILGPAPAPLQRLKSSWRWHLLFKSTSAVSLHKLLNQLNLYQARNPKVKVIFDIDPQEML